MKSFKSIKLMLFLAVVIALFASAASAIVTVSSVAWDDGSMSRTINAGQSVTFTINDIDTTQLNQVTFNVELRDSVTRSVVSQLLVDQVEQLSNQPLDYTVTINPADFNSQAGNYFVTIQVIEGTPTSSVGTDFIDDSLQLTVTTIPANTNPVFTTINGQPATANSYNFNVITGQTLTVDLTATDAENDPLTFVGVTAPGTTIPLPGRSNFNNINANTGRLIWNPAASQVGTHTLNLYVLDGHQNGYDMVEVVVNVQQNTAPSITVPQGIIPMAEGNNQDVTLTGTDAQGASLVYQGRVQPIGFVQNFMGTITTPLTSGSSFVSGIFSSIIPTVIFQGQPLPAGSSINGNIFSWTPDYTYNIHPSLMRSTTLEFRSCEDLGNNQVGLCSAWQAVRFEVQDVNQDVQIQSTPGTMATEGLQYFYQVNAVDADAEDTFTYSITSAVPSGMSIDNNGLLTWTPATNAFESSPLPNGDYQITIEADDGFGSIASQQWTITVIDNGQVNNAPTFTINNVAVVEGQTATIIPQNVNDADNDPITFSLGATTIPASATVRINPTTGVFEWDTVLGDSSATPYSVELIANDGNGGVTSRTTQITVSNTGNTAPVITVIPPQIVVAGQELRFQVAATDADNDLLTLDVYNLSSLPGTAQFPRTTGTGSVSSEFVWQTTAADVAASPYTVVFSVSDGINAEQIRSVQISVVTSGNTAPVILSNPQTTARVDVPYTYRIQAVDADNDPLTYRLITAADPSMTVDANGVVSWTPSQRGEYPVTIEVSDGVNRVRQSFVITVKYGGNRMEIASASVSPEVARPGDHVQLRVVVDNEGFIDLEELRIRAILYDLNMMAAGGEFDLDSGRSVAENVNLMIPYDAQPGDYFIKIIVGNDYFHDTVYRQITIV